MKKTKRCTNCGIRKRRNLFYRRSAMLDGLNSWCKKCLNNWNSKAKATPEARTKRSTQRKKFWRENNEMCRRRKREEWWRNRDRHLKENKKKYERHNEKYLAQMRLMYVANCDRIKERVRQWYQKLKCNPEAFRRHQRKACLRLYKLTLEQFSKLLKDQGNRCGICRSKEPGGYGVLTVDHDHKTKKVRKLLCINCNSGLGNFKDNPLFLRLAAKYVSTSRTGIRWVGSGGSHRNAHRITKERFGELFASQERCCKICRTEHADCVGKWKIDHDHTSLEIRGILCTTCNFGIGKFKDDPKLLKKAAKYLEGYRKRKAV